MKEERKKKVAYPFNNLKPAKVSVRKLPAAASHSLIYSTLISIEAIPLEAIT
jgi:hypothetical protein